MSFATRRIAAGFSLDDIASEFGASTDAVQEWEDGRTQPPQHVARSLDLIHSFGGGTVRTAEPALQQTARPKRKPAPGKPAESLIRSRQRVTDHGEVFTPPWLVEKMLDLVKGESERIDSRFLEPACGSGNFLVEVLKRKLTTVERKYGGAGFERKLYALQALACCYGIELLADNIAECRANMLAIFAGFLGLEGGEDFHRAASHVLSLNLVHGDAMTMKAADGGPIMIVEWTYLGKAGRFNRRDFRLEVLTGASGFNERWATPDVERQETLFEPTLAFHHRGRDPIFVPVGSHRPMTVRDLAALNAEVVE